MPIFEYYCSKCKEVFEELVMGHNQETPECPGCGQLEPVSRCMSAASIARKEKGSQGIGGNSACSSRGFA